jgi:photosystem II stability/assembly factor-like uncharacterized protein
MTIFLKLTRVAAVSLTLAALAACGSSGSSGPSGTNGTNGTNGVSGTSGLTALVAAVAESPGKNCTNGGNRITSGLDTNANGVLDPSEVTNTQYVCNGASGSTGTAGAAGVNGETTLIRTSTVAAGANCPNGGKQINIGLDTNRNGVLDPSEVTSSSYVCNGAGANGTNGINGENSLVTVVPEAAGANCSAGGSLVSSGLDTNGNGILDPGEVTNRLYICNGAAGAAGSTGLNSLISTFSLAVGDANCATGGTRVNSGVDTNGNGVLDPSEITNTQDVCNGAQGAPGAAGSNGQNSLVSLTTLTVGNASCPNGGTEAQSGIDSNGDGILEAGEVTNTAYACNGAPGATGATGATGSNGKTSLIAETPEAAGVNCTYGGVKVTSGIDANGDGILEAGEVQATSYVCNGPPGPGITWIDVTGTSVQAASNQGYLADNAAKVTITLPTAPVLGGIISVTGVGLGGWMIGQNAGQYVRTTALPGSPPATDHWILTSAPNNSWSSVASSADGSHLVATVYPGGNIYTSADSGNTWTPTSAPGNNWTSVASSADGSHLVAVAQGQGIYTSGDSGTTWTQTSAPSNLYWYSVASSADGSHLVAAIYGGSIYTSADSGTTWTLSSAPSNRLWHSVASSADGSHLVAVIYTGGIYTSADSGNTWTQTSAPNNGWSAVASSANGGLLVAVVIAGGGIYTSWDSGTTWTQTSAPNSSWYSVASSADGKIMVAVAPNGGIYTSANWGISWTQTSAANNNWVFVASSADGSHHVAVNSNAAGIYTSDFGQQTTPGTAGLISGSQDDAIELQYVGNGAFIVLDDTSNSGAFTVQ